LGDAVVVEGKTVGENYTNHDYWLVKMNDEIRELQAAVLEIKARLKGIEEGLERTAPKPRVQDQS
jgi:hypothetical protein